MNLILLGADEIRDGTCTLTGRRATHLIQTLGAEPGRVLRAGVVRGPRGEATVRGVEPGAVELEVALTGDPASPPPVDLIVALPRPKVLSRLLQLVASFGVARIDLVNAWRVEKSYFESPRLEAARLHEDLILGAEQGAHTWVPEVQVHRRLMPFLNEALPPAATDSRRRVLLHPGARRPLEEALESRPGRVVAAVGPEAGWMEREVETFVALGFEPAHLGEAVLRVEPAVAAFLGQLALLARLAPKR